MKFSGTPALAFSLVVCFNLAVPSSGQTQIRQNHAQKNGAAGQGGSQQGSSSAAHDQQTRAYQSAALGFQGNDSLQALYQPYVASAKQNQNTAFPSDVQLLLNLSTPTSGMSLEPADEALREHLQLPTDQGVVVLSLEPHSSPAQAGIQQNDVLLFVGDAPLRKPEDLDVCLKGAGAEPVPLTVLRGGKKLKFQVQPQVHVTLGPVQAQPPSFWIGVSVSAVGPALRSQLQLAEDKGLAVIEVLKDSPADRAGIKFHDILLTLAGKPLATQENLVEIVQANGEKSAALELLRGGKTQTIEVKPERRKPAHISGRISDPKTFYYVHPGAMAGNVNPGGGQSWERFILNPGQTAIQPRSFVWKHEPSQPKPKDAKDAVEKRLDDLDAEIKQLSKAIEELSRALKDRK